MSTRAVLIGEQNPYGGDTRYALYPYPPNCAGHRLQSKILGVSEREYIRDFARVNLCSGPWRAAEARERARQIVDTDDLPLVLLGVKVAAAFNVSGDPFTWRDHAVSKMNPAAPGDGRVTRRVVLLPHPSGRCRLWNGPESFERARAALREAGVLTALSSAPPEPPRG